MKKLLRFLFILLLLGLGFLYIVKNPELSFSQTILKTIGLERLTISDEPIAMGTGTFTLDEIGATFTLPQWRELQSAPVQESGEMKFVITTPEKDNKGYDIYLRGGYSVSQDTIENIQNLHKVQLTSAGQAFKVDCWRIAPNACMDIYNSGVVYILGFSATSDQPQPGDRPTEFAVPRFAQVQQAIDDMLASVVVVPMTESELTGSKLTGMEFSYPLQNDITVTKINPEFIFSSVFNPTERVQDRKDCNIKKSLKYFTDLLSKFDSDVISEYKFTYTNKKPTQADIELNWTTEEGRKVYILPNRAWYTTNKQFIEDFWTCGVAWMTPALVGKEYILFIDGCGSGAWEPFGCTDISNKLKDSIKVK